ncbi:hypothetical protein BDF19DRAFT_312894 [Syncephalis fuscata]|nr:hypothetical protein BDF19DRAFT_312894 [Syncephalis fuscata]
MQLQQQQQQQQQQLQLQQQQQQMMLMQRAAVNNALQQQQLQQQQQQLYLQQHLKTRQYAEQQAYVNAFSQQQQQAAGLANATNSPMAALQNKQLLMQIQRMQSANLLMQQQNATSSMTPNKGGLGIMTPTIATPTMSVKDEQRYSPRIIPCGIVAASTGEPCRRPVNQLGDVCRLHYRFQRTPQQIAAMETAASNTASTATPPIASPPPATSMIPLGASMPPTPQQALMMGQPQSNTFTWKVNVPSAKRPSNFINQQLSQTSMMHMMNGAAGQMNQLPADICPFCGMDESPVEDDEEQLGNRAVTGKDRVRCVQCRRSHHLLCTHLDNATVAAAVKSYPWQCNDCKTCVVCKEAGDESELLICDGCDRAWHMGCCDPAVKALPEGRWYCGLCARCHSCSLRSRKSHERAMTLSSDAFHPTTMTKAGTEGREVFVTMFCNLCHRDYEADRYCPVCIETYHAPSTQSSPNGSVIGEGEEAATPVINDVETKSESVPASVTASASELVPTSASSRPQRTVSKLTNEQVAKALAESDEDDEDDDDGEDDNDNGPTNKSANEGSLLPQRGRPRRSRLPPQRYPAGGEEPIVNTATGTHGRKRRRPPIPPQSPDNDDTTTTASSGGTDKDMVCCDRCDRWVHVTCDPSMTEAAYERLANDTGAHYVCPLCARYTEVQLAVRRPLQHGRAGRYPRNAHLVGDEQSIKDDALAVPVREVLIDVTGQRGLAAPALHATGHGTFAGDGRFRDQPWQQQKQQQQLQSQQQQQQQVMAATIGLPSTKGVS